MHKWFSYDHNGDGIELHKTAEEAKSNAEECMKEAFYMQDEEDCFYAGREEVVWGKLEVLGRAKVVDGEAMIVDSTV